MPLTTWTPRFFNCPYDWKPGTRVASSKLEEMEGSHGHQEAFFDDVDDDEFLQILAHVEGKTESTKSKHNMPLPRTSRDMQGDASSNRGSHPAVPPNPVRRKAGEQGTYSIQAAPRNCVQARQTTLFETFAPTHVSGQHTADKSGNGVHPQLQKPSVRIQNAKPKPSAIRVSNEVGDVGGGCSEMTRSGFVADLHKMDEEAIKTWIYPTNVPVRDYQFNIVNKGLLMNTLVALPTGLGKTFIAAVVMFNYFRWFPHGRIIFMAPTKPLVAQQIEACFKVTGIPQVSYTTRTMPWLGNIT